MLTLPGTPTARFVLHEGGERLLSEPTSCKPLSPSGFLPAVQIPSSPKEAPEGAIFAAAPVDVAVPSPTNSVPAQPLVADDVGPVNTCKLSTSTARSPEQRKPP